MLVGNKNADCEGNDETESNSFKNKIVVQNKTWTNFLQTNVCKV